MGKSSQLAIHNDNCDKCGARAGMSGGRHVIMLDEQEHLSAHCASTLMTRASPNFYIFEGLNLEISKGKKLYKA